MLAHSLIPLAFFLKHKRILRLFAPALGAGNFHYIDFSVNMHNQLHIYVQTNTHSDVLIVGTRDALAQLRDAISDVLEQSTRAAAVLTYAADGEGYTTYVVNSEILLDSQYKLGEDEYWNTVALPYLTLEVLSGISPWQVFSKALIFALNAAVYRDFTGEDVGDY